MTDLNLLKVDITSGLSGCKTEGGKKKKDVTQH